MNTNKADCRIQDPISFDTLQSIGRVLNRAIRQAERRGDLKKAKLVRRLGEIFVPNNPALELAREKLQIGRATSIRNRLTLRQAVREHCIDCVGSAPAIRDCRGNELHDRPCIFFSYRMGKGTSVMLIRKFCLNCMGGSWKLVKECPSKRCLFLCYRMRKNPGQRRRTGRFKSANQPPHEAISTQESTIGVVPIS